MPWQNLSRSINDKKLFTLMVICICLSAFDGLATIYHIYHGVASELNPLMHYLLSWDEVVFFFVKVFVTAAALIICYIKQDQQLGRIAIWFATVCYYFIFIYHILIYRLAYSSH